MRHGARRRRFVHCKMKKFEAQPAGPSARPLPARTMQTKTKREKMGGSGLSILMRAFSTLVGTPTSFHPKRPA